MNKLRKGDVVGRISYGKDIFFIIDRIIFLRNNKLAILKGLTVRIKADSPLEDLELIDSKIVKEYMNNVERKITSIINECKRNTRRKYNFGTILHLDGDSRYTQKSMRYYRNLGINAVVKHISESRQPRVIWNLLDRYNPDILVITGHDGMIKSGTGYNDMYNYRNSNYFVNSVIQARRWEKNPGNLSIFAGACQSYYEALIQAGANFASSPARILIDFIDPLIVAENIAYTDNTKYITIRDFEKELRDGQKGISGIGSKGKRKWAT